MDGASGEAVGGAGTGGRLGQEVRSSDWDAPVGGPDRAVIWTGEVLSGAEEKPFQTYGEMCFWREVSQQQGAVGTFFFRLHITPFWEECRIPVFCCSFVQVKRAVVRSDRKHGIPPTGKVWFSAHRLC